MNNFSDTHGKKTEAGMRWPFSCCRRTKMFTIGRLFSAGALWLCLCLCCASPAPAKDEPPPNLAEMFDHLNILEQKFNAQQWEDAGAAVRVIEQDYLLLVGTMKDDVPAATIQKFGFLVTNFKLRLDQKDTESLEKPFALLQSLFIDMMEHYEYPAPPVFLVTAWSLINMRQSLEREDFRFVLGKMEQFSILRERLTGAMRAKGAGDGQIAQFLSAIESIRKAALSRNRQEAQKQLDALDALISPLAGW